MARFIFIDGQGSGTTRDALEKAAELIISMLDELDGDPDLEPDATGYGDLDGLSEGERGEPSLGWTATTKQQGPQWWGDIEGRETDDSDREPSLGSCCRFGDKRTWASGASDDREGDEHDGSEPSLGSTEIGFTWSGDWNGTLSREAVGWDQLSWTLDCSDSDKEADYADREPSYGWTDEEAATGRYSLADRRLDDLEEQHDAEGDNADREWSLGWTLDCSEGKSGGTWLGEDGDLEGPLCAGRETHVVYIGRMTAEGFNPIG